MSTSSPYPLRRDEDYAMPDTAGNESFTSPFMSVRDLRAALDGAPDEAQIVVMVGGQEDRGVFAAWQSTLIPWSHDCTDAPDEHRPGRDCPTVVSFEIHAETASEAGDTEFTYAPGNGGSPFEEAS